MKVRIGITAPLVLEDEKHEELILPHFRDRNLSHPRQPPHAVWIESKTRLQSDSKSLLNGTTVGQPSRCARRATRPGTFEPGIFNSNVQNGRHRRGLDAQPEQRRRRGRPAICFGEESAARPRVVLVVDTSRAMKESAREISAALRSQSPDQIMLVLADGNGAYEKRAESQSDHGKSVRARAGIRSSDVHRRRRQRPRSRESLGSGSSESEQQRNRLDSQSTATSASAYRGTAATLGATS